MLTTPLLYTLFDTPEGDTTNLVERMRTYYTVRGVAPSITSSSEEVIIELDVEQILGRERMFSEAKLLCERGKFEQGRTKLLRLVEDDPTHSEYHRMLGQVAAELGQVDDAIDHLIDALKWDPKNQHALTMMGNIWARDKKDMETAMRYYQSALDIDPDDHIALNNIATQYLIMGDHENAQQWFQKAVEVESSYANAHHGIALIAFQRGDMLGAFEAAVNALQGNPNRDELYKRSVGLAMDAGLNVVGELQIGQQTVQREADELSKLAGIPIRIIADRDIATKAKIEFAEVYHRDEHVVRYNPDSPAVEHLQLHELYHLRFVTQARAEGTNELFVVRPTHKEAFSSAMVATRNKLRKADITDASIEQYLAMVFEGLNRQVFNAPIDLFIEWEIYQNHPEMRPFQFISLAALVQEAVQATTEKRIVELSPADVLSKSKTYSLTLAMLWKELYGVDRITDFNPTPSEKRLAEAFYEEFLEYRADRQPAEEYEVLQHWADDLKLTPYFSLVKETDYQAHRNTPISRSLDEVLKGIEDDPLNQFSDDPEREDEMETFLKARASQGTDPAVVMFMVDALRYLKALPLAKVKEIAFEIALTGTQGIEPEKQGYRLSNIPSKTFSGRHLLAYYYVSWKLAIPDMLRQLSLPYDEEFALAEQFEGK